MPFRAYAYARIRGRIYDAYKRRKFLDENHGPLTDKMPDIYPNPEDSMIERECRYKAFVELIARTRDLARICSVRQAQVMRMYVVDGMTEQEISAALGISGRMVRHELRACCAAALRRTNGYSIKD